MSPTVTHRLLTTLQNHGYIVQDTGTQRYELGMKFLEFSSLLQEKLNFNDLLEPFMKALAEESGETIFLIWLEERNKLSVIEVAESPQSIKFEVKMGTSSILHAGASNLIVLAHLPEETQNELLSGKLKKVTDRTVTDPIQLKKMLEKIKSQGWVSTVGEVTLDALGIGAPIFDCTGKIIGSLSLTGPAYRIPEKEVARMLELLLGKQEEIQKLINRLGLTREQIKRSL